MNNTKMYKILWANKLAKFFLILPVTALISLSSCNKASIVGLDIQPENDLINAEFVDSLTLTTQTIKEDTLRTDAIVRSGIGLIGKYIDPIFGEATSSLYTQLRLFSNAPSFGKNAVCDSVKLSLYYIDAYGEVIRHQQTINVYRLIADINMDANYFSNQKIAASSIDLANNYVFIPKPKDSLVVKGAVKLPPQLRVPLEKSFGQDILNQQNTTNLSTNVEFIKYIKGLYITTEKTQGLLSGQGNILRFNLNYSTIDIYYKYRADNALTDSAAQYSISLGNVGSFTHMSHDYSAANPDLKKQIDLAPPAQNDNIYVQSMAGLKTKIQIPHLLSWGKKELIAVNKAEIVIKPLTNLTGLFAIPPVLSLYSIQDDGKGIYILPDAVENSDEDRGKYDTLSTSKHPKTYHFTVTRYIQYLISEKTRSNGLILCVSSPASTANRVVLGGGGKDNNAYQMKLNITYTKLK